MDPLPDPAQMEIPETKVDDTLQVILNLCQRMVKLQEEIATDEEALKAKKDALAQIDEKLLPDLFASTGLTELNFRGRKISAKTEYFANISKANKDAAMDWLRRHNMGGIIKSELRLSADHGEQLAAAGIPFQRDETIHSSTLKAFVREQVEANNPDLPRELFGVYVAHKVVVHHD